MTGRCGDAVHEAVREMNFRKHLKKLDEQRKKKKPAHNRTVQTSDEKILQIHNNTNEKNCQGGAPDDNE